MAPPFGPSALKLPAAARSSQISIVARESREVIDGISVVGAAAPPLRALFGLAYFISGGINGARDGSFRDAFFFSVHTLQPVHARKRYEVSHFCRGARPADALSELPSGELQLDVRKFDEVTPTEPTETFPYPSAS